MPRVPPAAVGKSVANHRRALLAKGARNISIDRSMRCMEDIDLKPGYSTGEIPGKCIKCLAEQELNSCLRMLLIGEGEDWEVMQQYEMLLSFLKSPESLSLRDEAEKYLAEGKKVTLKLSFANRAPVYELEVI